MPNTVVWGGTYGAETYGQDPYGSRAFDSTAPSISGLSPANGAEGVLITDPITFQVYSPSALDPWSLSVTVDSVTLIAAGDFIPGNGGSIVFNGQTCTVNLSTHTTWPSGSNTLAISVTDLSGNPSTFNSTFIVETSNIVGVSDSVSLTDSLSAQVHGYLAVSDNIGLSDAITHLHQVGHLAVSDTLGLTDALSTHQVTHPTFASETLGLSDSVVDHQGFKLATSDSVPLTDSLTENPAYKETVADTIAVSDAVAYHYQANPHPSETVGLSETLTARHQAFEGLTETAISISDAEVNRWGAHIPVSDSIPLSDQVHTNTNTGLPLTDSVSVSDAEANRWHAQVPVGDTIPIADAVSSGEREPLAVADTVRLSESLGVSHGTSPSLRDLITVTDMVNLATPVIANDTTLTVQFSQDLRIDGIPSLGNYTLTPVSDGAFPVQLQSVQPTFSILATGSNASIIVGDPFYEIHIPTVDFTTLRAGYLFVSSPTNQNMYLRIVSIVNPTTVLVDLPLLPDPLNGSILWEAIPGITGLIFQTSKFTNGGRYSFSAAGLLTISGLPYASSAEAIAVAPQPQVLGAAQLLNGQILVSFSDVMLVDEDLLDPAEYLLSGPGNPLVMGVATANATQVSLVTQNLGSGDYSLQVGTGTPHDLAGNPIDPFYNTVVFTSTPSITNRSIFVDHGPIARPPLTLEDGAGVLFVDFQTVTLTGAALSPSFAGFQLVLSGTTHNDGSYLILVVKTQNTVKLVASFNLPDAGGGTASWSVVNPRDGEIADDPAHVSVTINGSPVIPEAVVGLLGQIVLPSAPAHDQNVLVNYSWVLNPTVEIRRLNSQEFRLNSWNRDLGYLPGGSHYRYNNVLPVPTNFTSPPPIQQGTRGTLVPFETSQFYLPDGNILSDYTGLNLVLTAGINAGVYDIVSVIGSHIVGISGTLNLTDPLSGHIPWTIGDTSDISAILPQPLLRDLKYRAYERAYTALLNDPNTLTLNAATNLIAYPPLSRVVSQTFVSYESNNLPQNDPVSPWTLAGTGAGSASIVNLQLVVNSPISGSFPGGSPIYWVQEVDETFPHVFAATWDVAVTSTPVTQGVFTGVAFGYSDEETAVVFGYLTNGGVNQIGFLVRGAGNDPSAITGWTGGLDSLGNPTNAPMTYDWSQLTSYRIYQDPSGNISLYLNGAVIPSMMVTEEQLPFLEELAVPFNSLQGVFFGSLSAQAQNSSTWDFVRYLVLPLNPLQTAPSIYVDYSGNVLPESAPKPWTPVGYHGTETILGSEFLLLDSTSAVPETEEIKTGLIGGDFRGFFRLEPLIAASAEVVVDFNVQLRTWTQGFSPNAMMVAIDDSDRLIQLSFITDLAAPKFSYGGNGLPTVQTPPWSSMGTQTGQMLGRTLQIIDASAQDGLIYVIDDTNPVTSDSMTQVSHADIRGHATVAAMATVQHGASASIVADSYVSPPSTASASLVMAGASMTASATLHQGMVAHIEASSIVTGSILVSPPSRVLSPDNGYILEARLRPLSFTPDPSGFIGAMAETYDSQRTLGFALYSIAGVLSVALQGEGQVIVQVPFNWNDGNYHTYRVVYSPAFPTGVVTLFIDGLMAGAPQSYSSFPVPIPQSTTGFVAFGSTNPGTESISTVNWIYCNAWRVETGQKFVGIWRGTTTGSLVDYWVPTKATGSNSLILGNALMDTNANFIAAGVQPTDYLIIDVGPNQGIYQITGVHANTLAIDVTWPSAPSKVSYRIAQQTDWTQPHAYRLIKAPAGDQVAVFVDGLTTPLILLTYDDSILPPSQVGLPRIIAGTLPSVSWGAFDPTNLSQSSWEYVRYGVTRSPTELRIIPPHQVLNQRNLIQSFERHTSNLPHTLTDFWSESEGITPNTYPDFLTNPDLTAYTLLNETTPLVPQTQTYQVANPQPTIEYIGSLNNIANVLNSDGSFLLNDATTRIGIIVPNNVLYDSLQIFERDTGVPNLIAPFSDEGQPTFGAFHFDAEVCLTYDAQTLPENDPTAITPWSFYAQDAAHVTRSVFGGVLTYGTDSVGTQTNYLNESPLPDAPSLETEITFRLKLLQDSSGGLGDSQVRFGFSAIGLTASLALVTAQTGLRYVLVIDQLSNKVLGGIPFDFYDGQYHTYRLVRNPGANSVQVFVDS